MTNPYAEAAKNLMDLWQKQVAGAMQDKAFMQAMLDMMQSLQQTGTYGQKTTATAAGAAPAAHDEPHDLAQLAFRLGECERRLERLERASGAAKSPRKRSSKTKRRAS
ncbi:MAG: hypothetical protein LW823_09005 [Rickettsiales bacterium]|nr:hypothetical protein [Rickettsiales bacterium]